MVNPICAELSEQDVVTIPTVIKNKILMAPGKWNDIHYSAEEIKKAFENTNWNDKDAISIILDHADKPLSVHDWVGWVRNPRLEGNNLVGDLELYDENIIVKLLKAKAKFGISPRIRGTEDKGELKDFVFENFSIVTNPAVKKAYINLSQAQIKSKQEVKKMPQESKKKGVLEEEETEVAEEETTEEEEEEVTEEMASKDKKSSEEEMSEKELLDIVSMSDWTDFVASMRKKYPKMSFKDIAKAYKEKSKESEELEQLSEEEIVSKIEQLTNILRRKKKYPYPYEEESSEKKIKEMEQKIQELSERLNAPDAKSVQELSQDKQAKVSVFATNDKLHKPGTLAMAEFLRSSFA